MEVTYHLKESEFDQNVFEAIKTAFKNRFLTISVVTNDTPTVDATHSYAASIPYTDLARLADALDNDESIDLMAEISKFKVVSE